MAYKLILAPSGAGKTTLAEAGKALDGDHIIAVTCGWPRKDSPPAVLHDGAWWKEARTVRLIHSAHASVIGTWISGPDKPYPAETRPNIKYLTDVILPVMFNTGADVFLTHPLITPLMQKGEVAIWVPTYDATKDNIATIVDMLLARMAGREAKAPSRKALDRATIEGNVAHLLSAAKKYSVPLLTGANEPEEVTIATTKVVITEVPPKTEENVSLIAPQPDAENAPLKDVKLSPKEKPDERIDGSKAFSDRVTKFFESK